MSVKRIVDTAFWFDEKVELFTPEEKYFWLFLLTNPFTSQLGIYRITKKQMSNLTGYDEQTINKLIERFENYGVIKYIDNEMAIKNYLKFAIVKGGKPVEDCLKKDLTKIKSKELINWMFKSVLKYEYLNSTAKKVIEDYYRNENDNVNENDNDNERNVNVSSNADKIKEIIDKQLSRYLEAGYSKNKLERIKAVILSCKPTEIDSKLVCDIVSAYDEDSEIYNPDAYVSAIIRNRKRGVI